MRGVGGIAAALMILLALMFVILLIIMAGDIVTDITGIEIPPIFGE